MASLSETLEGQTAVHCPNLKEMALADLHLTRETLNSMHNFLISRGEICLSIRRSIFFRINGVFHIETRSMSPSEFKSFMDGLLKIGRTQLDARQGPPVS
jgi:hypothetical protein